MGSQSESFDTQHQDMIHDTQPDYYGRRIATCSSDRMIKIFDVTSKQCVAQLQGHEAAVWQVAWAHPKFGSILASCGYDRRVIVWRETAEGQWSIMFDHCQHTASVNSVVFAPPEYGLVLACASSDGSVSVCSLRDDGWQTMNFDAHSTGCNAVSFAPFFKPGSLVGAADGPNPLQLATAGCDNLVKIWEFDSTENKWNEKHSLRKHSDWVRDVAWAPNIGLPTSTIASCSQDRSCVVWTQGTNGEWSSTELKKFTAPVWRVSWSITGNILAVSGGDNRVTLWKEASPGEWKPISSVSEEGVTDN